MKKILLFVAFLGIALTSCKKDEPRMPSVDDYQHEKVPHYFYVQNNLSKHLKFEFNSVSYEPENDFLLDDFTINHHYKVTAFRNQKTLVRVYYQYRGAFNNEALNLFYYTYGTPLNETIIKMQDPESRVNFKDNLWNGEMWDYEQKGKYEAEYTLVVDEEFLKTLTPYWVPDEETNPQ